MSDVKDACAYISTGGGGTIALGTVSIPNQANVNQNVNYDITAIVQNGSFTNPAVGLFYTSGPANSIKINGRDVTQNYGIARYYLGQANEGYKLELAGTLNFPQEGNYLLRASAGSIDPNTKTFHEIDGKTVTVSIKAVAPSWKKYIPYLVLGGSLMVVMIAVGGKRK